MSSNPKGLSRIFQTRDQTGELTEDMIIKGIIDKSERIIAKVYKDNMTKIRNLVWSFHNMQLNVEDIYQDGFTIAIMNISNGKFRGESSFSTYLNSICRNICLKRLTNKSNLVYEDGHDQMEETGNHMVITKLLEMRTRLDAKCREIIDLRFTLGGKINEHAPNKCLSFEEIGEHLGISTDNARQRFKRCLDGFRKMVLESNDLQEHYYSI